MPGVGISTTFILPIFPPQDSPECIGLGFQALLAIQSCDCLPYWTEKDTHWLGAELPSPATDQCFDLTNGATPTFPATAPTGVPPYPLMPVILN